MEGKKFIHLLTSPLEHLPILETNCPATYAKHKEDFNLRTHVRETSIDKLTTSV